jgi:hypothetical protein
MSWLGWLRPKESYSIVCVDIGATTLAAAYVHYSGVKPPEIVYEKKVAIEFRESESPEQSVFRSLQAFLDTVIKEGAPVLLRATGSGSVHIILVSVDAPWQKTSVRSEFVEDKKPFVFTRRLVDAVAEKTRVKTESKMLVDESIIGTLLNGYETAEPFGKEAHRAEVVILTSLIDERVAGAIVTTIRRAYHTHRIYPIAGTSLRYQAIRSLFPHERDALILDVTGTLTSIALVRSGILVSIVELDERNSSLEMWIERVKAELGNLAREYPLPRMLFLVAREPEGAELQKALAGASLSDLWLSENPPTVVPIVASILTQRVRVASADSPDLLIFLMALYWQQRERSNRI